LFLNGGNDVQAIKKTIQQMGIPTHAALLSPDGVGSVCRILDARMARKHSTCGWDSSVHFQREITVLIQSPIPKGEKMNKEQLEALRLRMIPASQVGSVSADVAFELLEYIEQQESRIGALTAENSALRGRLLVARTHLTFALDALDLPMVE
jgi:hypothetical protein